MPTLSLPQTETGRARLLPSQPRRRTPPLNRSSAVPPHRTAAGSFCRLLTGSANNGRLDLLPRREHAIIVEQDADHFQKDAETVLGATPSCRRGATVAGMVP